MSATPGGSRGQLVEQLKQVLAVDNRRDSSSLQAQSELFTKLGLSYLQNDDVTMTSQGDPTQRLISKLDRFVFASGLFNAALVRNQDKTRMPYIESLLDDLKTAFMKAIRPHIDEDSWVRIWKEKESQYKSQLGSSRNKVKVYCRELSTILSHYKVEFKGQGEGQFAEELQDKVERVSREIARDVRELMAMMIADVVEFLGPAPCEYCILGLGSLAREECTPYSDIEFVILVGENTEKVQEYFCELTFMFQLKVLDFRETILPALGIPCLNDFYAENGDWFYDDVTPSGLKLDGAMPWACKLPTGHKQTDQKGALLLIKTPEEMAELQTVERQSIHGYHIAEILSCAVRITGSEELYDDYQRRFWAILKHKAKDMSLAASRGRDYLRTELTDFQKRMSQKGDARYVYKAKHDMYRLPTLLLANLRLLVESPIVSSWDFLAQLQECDGVIQKDFLDEFSFLLNLSLAVRLVVYSQKQRQWELFSLDGAITLIEVASKSFPKISRINEEIFARQLRAIHNVSLSLQAYFETPGSKLSLIEGGEEQYKLQMANLFTGVDAERSLDFFYQILDQQNFAENEVEGFILKVKKSAMTEAQTAHDDDVEKLRASMMQKIQEAVMDRKKNSRVSDILVDYMARFAARGMVEVALQTLQCSVQILQLASAFSKKRKYSMDFNQVYRMLRFILILLHEEYLQHDTKVFKVRQCLEQELTSFISLVREFLRSGGDINLIGVGVNLGLFLVENHFRYSEGHYLDLVEELQVECSAVFGNVERLGNQAMFSSQSDSNQPSTSKQPQDGSTPIDEEMKLTNLDILSMKEPNTPDEKIKYLELCRRIPSSVKFNSYIDKMVVAVWTTRLYQQETLTEADDRRRFIRHMITMTTDADIHIHLTGILAELCEDTQSFDQEILTFQQLAMDNGVVLNMTAKFQCAMIHYRNGDYTKAHDLLIDIKSSPGITDEMCSSVSCLLALTSHMLAISDRCIAFSHEATSRFVTMTTRPSHITKATILLLQGHIEIELKRYDTAKMSLLKALQRFTVCAAEENQLYLENQIVQTYALLAYNQALQGDYTSAVQYTQEAVSLLLDLIREGRTDDINPGLLHSVHCIDIMRLFSRFEKRCPVIQKWTYCRVVLSQTCHLLQRQEAWVDLETVAREGLEVIGNIPHEIWTRVDAETERSRLSRESGHGLGRSENFVKARFIRYLALALQQQGKLEEYFELGFGSLDALKCQDEITHNAWCLSRDMIETEHESEIFAELCHFLVGESEKESGALLQEELGQFKENLCHKSLGLLQKKIFHQSKAARIFNDLRCLSQHMANKEKVPDMMHHIFEGYHLFTMSQSHGVNSANHKAEAIKCLLRGLNTVQKGELPAYDPPFIAHLLAQLQPIADIDLD